jgi:hypothetical protein
VQNIAGCYGEMMIKLPAKNTMWQAAGNVGYKRTVNSLTPFEKQTLILTYFGDTGEMFQVMWNVVFKV